MKLELIDNTDDIPLIEKQAVGIVNLSTRLVFVLKTRQKARVG